MEKKEEKTSKNTIHQNRSSEQYKKSGKKKKTNKAHIENPTLSSLVINFSELNDPFVKRFEKQLINNLFVSNNDKILVAVSGGVDSVSLLYALFILKSRYNFKLYVAHFNHKIRETSDEDEQHVKKLCEKLGISFYTTSAKVEEYAQEKGLSVEHAGRNLRYAFFDKIASSLGILYVATAHNSNDSAETFLMNLFRGSGLSGLSGIPQTRRLSKKSLLIRPFLTFTKDEIIKFAKRFSLEWREDETNQSNTIPRNKIRNVLLPMLQQEFSPSVITQINQAAQHISGANDFITEKLTLAMANQSFEKKKLRISLKTAWLKTFSTFIQGEIISILLKRDFKLQYVSLSAIQRVLELLISPTGAQVELTGDIIALKDRDYIIISKSKAPLDLNMDIEKTGSFEFGSYKLKMSRIPRNQVNFTTNPFIEYFDADKLSDELEIRTWQQGDSFTPIGAKGNIKLSDFLINQKVNLLDKQSCIVLCSSGEIAWVVGRRISDKFKITPETKKVIKAE